MIKLLAMHLKAYIAILLTFQLLLIACNSASQPSDDTTGETDTVTEPAPIRQTKWKEFVVPRIDSTADEHCTVFIDLLNIAEKTSKFFDMRVEQLYASGLEMWEETINLQIKEKNPVAKKFVIADKSFSKKCTGYYEVWRVVVDTRTGKQLRESTFFQRTLTRILAQQAVNATYVPIEEGDIATYVQSEHAEIRTVEDLGIDLLAPTKFRYGAPPSTLAAVGVRACSPLKEILQPAFDSGEPWVVIEQITIISDGEEIGLIDSDRTLAQILATRVDSDANVVKLTLRLSEDTEAEHHDIEIEEACPESDSPFIYGRIDEETAYLKVRSFDIDAISFVIQDNPQQSVEDELKELVREQINDYIDKFGKIIEEINEEEIRALLIDLRDNPGGRGGLAEVFVDAFIDKGPIVHMFHSPEAMRSETVDTEFSAALDGKLVENDNLIIFVLIDESSASAAEIVAGNLKLYGAAVVVGKPSFGKGLGSKPTLYVNKELGYFGEIVIPSGRYVLGDGTDAHRAGIQPHIVIEDPEGVRAEQKWRRHQLSNASPALRFIAKRQLGIARYSELPEAYTLPGPVHMDGLKQRFDELVDRGSITTYDTAENVLAALEDVTFEEDCDQAYDCMLAKTLEIISFYLDNLS